MGTVAETEVLVVGAGPCGLMAAVTAARYGTRVLVVEQRAGGSTLSRALVVSTRGMELMRRLGLEAAVRAGAADVEPTAMVTSTLASAEGVVLPLGFPSAAEAAAASPCRPAWVPQCHYEPLLASELEGEPTATVRFGTRFVGLEQRHGSSRATVLDVDTGTRLVVDARFVIGADGAHSIVRDAIGVEMEGSDDLGDYERVEFAALLDDVVAERAHALYVLKHPAVEGAVLARRSRGNCWSLSRERPQGVPGMADLSRDDLLALIRTAAGVPDLDATVDRLSRFTFAAQIAAEYRRDNVFLIGDAAHRTTPRGGTGLNTGIQDGFDIGWKLAWVLHGWAGAQLLDSYETERRPVGLHNVGRSAAPGGAQRSTDQALSWDLDGRVAHAWLDHDGARMSTIDLVGDGLTVFTGADQPAWADVADTLGWTAPVEVVVLPGPVCAALDLPSSGALLVRPDGHEVARWTTPDAPPAHGPAWPPSALV